MEYLELADTKTGIAWWNEARVYLNKAIKAHNKFVDNEITLKKYEKRVKKSYKTLIKNNFSVSYEKDFYVMTALLRDNGCDICWYYGF